MMTWILSLLLQYEGKSDDVKYGYTNATAVQVLATSYSWLIVYPDNGSEMIVSSSTYLETHDCDN